MFERLDPPEHFRPDEAFRAGARQRGGRRRRNQRLLVSAVGTVMLLIVAAGATTAYARNRWDHVQRVDVGSLPPPPAGLTSSFNILVVGTDAGVVPNQATARTDSIAVLHVDPGSGKVQALSIPRDLWVPIAGTGRHGRINTAFESSPQELVHTLQSALGISVEHVVIVDFAGFEKLVDAVGGIRVEFPDQVRSVGSTGFAAPAGCVTLDGTQALALARTRKDLEILKDGYWHLDQSGDIGRMGRQQTVALAFLVAFHRSAVDPVSELRLLNALLDHVTIDSRFTSGEMANLVAEFHSLQADDISFAIPPVSEAVIGGADVLVLNSASEAALKPFQSGPFTPEIGPSATMPLQAEVTRLDHQINALQAELDMFTNNEDVLVQRIAEATDPTVQSLLADQLLNLKTHDAAKIAAIENQLGALEAQRNPLLAQDLRGAPMAVNVSPNPTFVFSAC
jgi:LCP family protein required for cell wall assembly